MAGLVKAKKYDWKDSNLALFGSDTEKEVKKESAMSEPAWEGAGEDVGVQVWRIEKFEVKPIVDKDDIGNFFRGDSYIVLNTYKLEDSDDLKYDVHFWIGEHSTQDEYCTAAYKTVELDTFLDDAAVQHREVEGCESSSFKKYFSKFTVLNGGCDSGFNHVEPETYTPRLLHFKNGEVHEVEKKKRCLELHPEDIFVLDKGDELRRCDLAGCSILEKTKCTEYLDKLVQSRGGSVKPSTQAELEDELEDGDLEDDVEEDTDEEVSKLLKVSDADGSLDMEEVKTGPITMEDMDENDVMLVHLKERLYVVIGGGASKNEKKNGMGYANKYLSGIGKCRIGITVCGPGDMNIVQAALTA